MCSVFKGITKFGLKRRTPGIWVVPFANVFDSISLKNRLLHIRLLHSDCQVKNLLHNVTKINIHQCKKMTTIEPTTKTAPPAVPDQAVPENVVPEVQDEDEVTESKEEQAIQMPGHAVPIVQEKEESIEAMILKKAAKFGIDPSQLSRRAKRRMCRSAKSGAKKQTKKLKKLNDPNADLSAGYNHKIFEDTEYYFENGLRKVYPYYFTFTAYTKKRWIGRPLLEVFTKEFRGETEEYYRCAIECGSMTVNGKTVGVDYELGPSDLVAHKIHRHENPVCDQSLQILHEDEDVLVVNKPSSIPCHPCGRYRFNSLVFILGKEMKRANLRNIYRLDRLTSGVLVCGKTAKRTAQLEKHVVSRNVEKEYVCRVIGEFPDGRITVDQPLDVLSNRIAVWKVSPTGKPSQTIFEKISFNGKTSVVKCYPKTGRTHQIRVHLQYLGYPIVNDPIYNCTAFGPGKGKGGDFGKPEEEVIEAIESIHNVGEWADGENPLFARKLAESSNTETSQGETIDPCSVSTSVSFEQTGKATDDNAIEPPVKRPKMAENVELQSACEVHVELPPNCEQSSSTVPRSGFDLAKWIPDLNCVGCKTRYIDPSPENLVMYLHALRYKNFTPREQNWNKRGDSGEQRTMRNTRLNVDYYFENGLRKVYPYYFTFYTTAQKKWEDKLVLDVFTEEFSSNTRENYTKAIETGDLLVNDQRIPLDYKLRIGDTVSSKTHRHENPVLDLPIEIIYEDREMLVVNKPSGIPCQPSGRFKTNSVSSILQKDLNINYLKNMYHLDWQGSGLMVFAKTKTKLDVLEHQVHSGMVTKEFLARVEGEFPYGKVVVDNAQEIVSHKLSLWKIHVGGKPSKTVFERISYNGKSSLVRCIPEVGRTAHQIRVHLQYMGHPIINDPVYNNEAWGPNKGKGAQYERPMDEVIEELSRTTSVGYWLDEENPLLQQKIESEGSKGNEATEAEDENEKQDDTATEGQEETAMDTSEPLAKRVKTDDESEEQAQEKTAEVAGTTFSYNRKWRKVEVKHFPFNIEKWNYDSNCAECKRTYVDPAPGQMGIYLHAQKFETEEWEYYTKFPEWAKDTWQEGDEQEQEVEEGTEEQEVEGAEQQEEGEEEEGAGDGVEDDE